VLLDSTTFLLQGLRHFSPLDLPNTTVRGVSRWRCTGIKTVPPVRKPVLSKSEYYNFRYIFKTNQVVVVLRCHMLPWQHSLKWLLETFGGRDCSAGCWALNTLIQADSKGLKILFFAPDGRWRVSHQGLGSSESTLMVRSAQRITGGKLPALQDIYSTRCHRKAKKDINQPSHGLFTPLSSRRRGQHRCIKAGTEIMKNNFYLKSIRLLNSHH
jgi:hypothetical protein